MSPAGTVIDNPSYYTRDSDVAAPQQTMTAGRDKHQYNGILAPTYQAKLGQARNNPASPTRVSFGPNTECHLQTRRSPSQSDHRLIGTSERSARKKKIAISIYSLNADPLSPLARGSLTAAVSSIRLSICPICLMSCHQSSLSLHRCLPSPVDLLSPHLN